MLNDTHLARTVFHLISARTFKAGFEFRSTEGCELGENVNWTEYSLDKVQW